MNRYQNYIKGQWHDHGGAAENINPSDTSDIIGTANQSELIHVQAAIESAAEAAEAWATSNTQLRADILDRVGQKLLQNKEAHGELLSREQGKPIAEGRGEVERAARIFTFFAGETIRLQGACGPSIRENVDVRVDRFPVGVIGIITPWNFPIAIPAWKVAPALAFGNTVVFKPAGITPACADLLAKLLDEAGLPPGVFNLVHGSGRLVGNALVESPDVAAITFTGSDGVGRGILAACSASGKKCQLELGGKNPLIIADDADLDKAVAVAANGSFGGNGQKCTASSRIIVMSEVYDEFTGRLVDKMKSLKVGHALDTATDIGPVADENQFNSIQSYLDLARAEGSQVITSERPNLQHEGYYIPPALFLNADPESRTSTEEIFGPCASVFQASSFDDAITLANNTKFGLSSGLCTTSLAKAEEFRKRTRTGLAMVNLPTAGVDYHVPFGGVKASGYGPKEQGSAAREFYTETRVTYSTA